MKNTKAPFELQPVLEFLQKVDEGYNPTESEREWLFNTTSLSGVSSSNIIALPKSMVLLCNLESLDLSMSKITDASVLSGLKKLHTLDLSFTSIDNFDFLMDLSQLEFLDLQGLQLPNADVLANLVNLQHLDLGRTRIYNIDFLSSLPHLKSLHIHETTLEDMSVLGKLRNLEMLCISGNYTPMWPLSLHNEILSSLPINDSHSICLDFLHDLKRIKSLFLHNIAVKDTRVLTDLTSLERLTLYAVPITEFGFLTSLTQLKSLNIRLTNSTDPKYAHSLNSSYLSAMMNLEDLDLAGVHLNNIEGLSTLAKLKTLTLVENNLRDIGPLASLTNIESLYLYANPIKTVIPLSNLAKLKHLNLSYTNVADINKLRNLKELEYIDLSYISSLHTLPYWLGELKQLKRLYLRGLRLHDIPASLLDLDLPFSSAQTTHLDGDGIYLRDTTIATQPISLFEQPKELIRAYYEADKTPINEAKVIFLGDGGAGKTHTIRRILNGGKKEHYNTETTPGIDITDYTAEHDNLTFRIHFWDFGGQEIMHAMHRCFLTDRTCYVIVVSNRWDLNGRARYWLKNIDSFAKGAPVLLAINRWDNIDETGIDMRRLTDDYPNLIRQPVYYSAKDSDNAEFNQLIDAIVREASRLDSTTMSFPVQWAAIRNDLLTMADNRYYIDKTEYHHICDEKKLESQQIRTWLLEWFNDLGVCFSYHQDARAGTELDSYKVLNPRWLTNAIYVIINAGRQYADKGRMPLRLIRDLLKLPGFGVLKNVSYTEGECDYVLEVMRKFNLSYRVSSDMEFIPALCDSETPECLHPITYNQRISYQIKYTYLPDSVVHQLMIRSYKNLNPEKIWRKGLRIDSEWLKLSAVVDMGNDDSTLQIDVYSYGDIEPWKLLSSIRDNISTINEKLGLHAKDYIVIHANNGDILKTVDELLDAKDQGLESLLIHNPYTHKYESHSVDELLGNTFGKEVLSVAEKLAQDNNRPLSTAFSVANKSWNEREHANSQALAILTLLIQHECETNTKLLDCLISSLREVNTTQAQSLVQEVEKSPEKKKGLLKRLEDTLKSPASILTSGKTIVSGAKTLAEAIENALPEISQIFPDLPFPM